MSPSRFAGFPPKPLLKYCLQSQAGQSGAQLRVRLICEDGREVQDFERLMCLNVLQEEVALTCVFPVPDRV